MANRNAIEKDVLDFLDVNRGKYNRALEDFRDIFVSYQRSAEGKRLIYRVASRGGYQNGEELKKVNRLVDKIEEKRRSLFSWDDVPNDRSEELIRFPEILRFFRDDGIGWAKNAKIRKSGDGKTIRIFKDENSAEIMIAEKKKKATLKISDGRTHDLKVKKVNGKLNIYKPGNDPGYTIDKVPDMIGIRLLCIHPSDVEVLKKYILNNKKLIVPPNGVEEHNDESGYRGLHVIVTLKSPVELKNIKCEIQIITMLQEAWGFKTHGPIYEKRKHLEEEYKKHAKFLSDYLDTVDKQTEFLLKEIQRRRDLEDQRRSAIIKEHLFWLLPKAVELDSEILTHSKSNGIDFESIHDPEIAMKLMINLVKEKIADKSKDQDISGQLDLAMKEVKEYENKYKIFDNSDKFSLCEDILHIVALVEAREPTGKFSNESLDHVDRLLRCCDKGSENEVKAHLHKALILYCFGNFEEAREEAEKALFVATNLNNLDLINDAKNSYGYFSAEWVDNNRTKVKGEEVKEIKEKVFQYLNEAIENETNSKENNQYKDTLAFAYIVFGSNENEIARGIEICKKIFQTAQEDELAKIYYKKHMRRAHERMLELI